MLAAMSMKEVLLKTQQLAKMNSMELRNKDIMKAMTAMTRKMSKNLARMKKLILRMKNIKG